MKSSVNFVKDLMKQKNLPFDSITDDLIKELYSEFINAIMLAERTAYLNNNPDDDGNGYRPKTLQTAGDNIDICVPRTRSKNFRPAILPPPFQRYTRDYKELVYNLMAANNSKAQIREIFNNMDFSLSESAIDEIHKELLVKIQDFKTRQLPEDLAVLFIDGKYISIKQDNKVQQMVLYILLGYDLDAKKHILGYYVFSGKETINQWKKVFNDLINRNLKNVLLFVCDNLSGMTDTLNILFDNPDIQLCLVHIKRNIRKHLHASDADSIIAKIDELKTSNLSAKDAADAFRTFLLPFRNSYNSFVSKLSADADYIFTFLGYPPQLHKIIYSTNPVESLNNQIEKLVVKYEGYFQSMNILDINLFLLKSRWEFKWLKNVSPFFAKFSAFFRKKLFLKKNSLSVDNTAFENNTHNS